MHVRRVCYCCILRTTIKTAADLKRSVPLLCINFDLVATFYSDWNSFPFAPRTNNTCILDVPLFVPCLSISNPMVSHFQFDKLNFTHNFFSTQSLAWNLFQTQSLLGKGSTGLFFHFFPFRLLVFNFFISIPVFKYVFKHNHF